MSNIAGQTVVRLKDFRVADVGNQVSSAMSSIAGQLADGVQRWTSKAKSAAKTTDGFVRSSPWQAVGAIALAGVAAGILMSRSARRARQRAPRTDRDSPAENSGG
jgi:ElaB/YqjD/DUF883 family membrane-anchored ribosome-binding protein